MKTHLRVLLSIFALLWIQFLSTSCNKSSVNNSNDNQTSTVTDQDGNVYHTVTIGTQVWMVENLKTTRLNDGTQIPNVVDSNSWGYLTTPAYCYYNNWQSYGQTYGVLYNWFAVESGKLAPKGWHVPSKTELEILQLYLGGNLGGGKLKETGTAHWNSPNNGATNETGFYAFGGGKREVTSDGTPSPKYLSNFRAMNEIGEWWTSTIMQGTNNCYFFKLWSADSELAILSFTPSNNFRLQDGRSIRCIKD
jgi:uncharacterized protein (TIGR02145 family)